jgi:hypothetical protein
MLPSSASTPETFSSTAPPPSTLGKSSLASPLGRGTSALRMLPHVEHTARLAPHTVAPSRCSSTRTAEGALNPTSRTPQPTRAASTQRPPLPPASLCDGALAAALSSIDPSVALLGVASDQRPLLRRCQHARRSGVHTVSPPALHALGFQVTHKHGG